MSIRRTAAILFLLVALALFAVAFLPRPQLHSLLSERAGHSVSQGYVDLVHERALICGAIALVSAVAWLLVGRALENHRSPSVRETGWIQRPTTVALLLIAIGVIARAILLTGPPHYDETFTVAEFVRRSPLFFLSRYTHANNHVFHTLLVWLVPGEALWSARLAAFIAGVGVLFATYTLARKWHGEDAARVAVALAAAASPLVEYSVQARGYTILTLAFLLLFLLEDDRLRAVALALGAWTIPTMLYAAAAWAVWMAVSQRAWKRIAVVAATGGALTFLLYLPILIVTGIASITSNGNTLSVPYPILFEELPKTFVQMAGDWSLSFTVPMTVVLGFAAIIAMVRREGIALVSTLCAIAVMLLILRKVPFPRVWIFVLPLVLIAAASAIAKIRIPSLVLVAATLVFSANAVRVTARDTYVEDPAMRDAAEIARVIESLPLDARVLVTTPLDAPYAFYVAGPRIVQDRFDSDPAEVRAAMLRAPRRYAVVSHRGSPKLDALSLPFTAVPVVRFRHSTLVELRSPR